MHQIFDFGYLSKIPQDELKTYLARTGAIIVDARFSPMSRDPRWRKSFLEKQLGEHYTHQKDLGNKNYKVGDHSIEFVNLESGFTFVKNELEKHPVIIMCGCWDRPSCHRTEFVRIFEQRTGMASIPLTRDLVREENNKEEPKQLDLFGA